MTYTKTLLFLAFCLLSPDLFAAGVFDVVPTDKSKEYLGIIFGGSVGAVSLGGGGNPLLSKMFERFNFIIVTVGVLVISYVGVVAAINTAREGEAMGKKFSLWVPLRALFGMLMMLPSPGSGYSVVQMTVVWLVLNGIGAANAVWNVVLDQLASGVKAVGAVDLPDIKANVNNFTKDVINMSVCQDVLNQLDLDLTKKYGPVKVNILREKLVTTVAPSDIKVLGMVQVKKGAPIGYQLSAEVRVGVESNRSTESRGLDNLCGNFKISTTLNYKSPEFSPAAISKRLEIKLNAVKAIFDSTSSAAEALATPLSASMLLPSVPVPTAPVGTYEAAYKNYMAQIAQLVTGTPKNASKTSEQIKYLKAFGWIHAGGFYFAMTQGSTVDIGDATKVPSTDNVPIYNSAFAANPSLSPGFSALLTSQLQDTPNKVTLNKALGQAQRFAKKDMGFSLPGLPSLGSDSPSTGNGDLDDLVQSVLRQIRTPIVNFFLAEFSGATEDPLLSIGKFGTTLMFAGEIATFSMAMLSAVIMWAFSSGSCLSPLGFGWNMLLLQVFPTLFGAIVLMWAAGATLGVYVPMIPYLIFTATAIGWMLAVIEGIVGAPIIALGLVQPSGEELGKIAPALGILANIFLRPTLMIFGFVIAGSLLRGILAMINFGFVSTLNVAVPTPTFLSIIPTLVMYVFLIVAVVNQSFSLIYELPNKVLRFMGVQPEGGTPEKMLSETKGGFESGAKAAGDTQKGIYDSGKEKLQTTQKEAEKAKKKGGGSMPPAAPSGST